MDPMGIGGIFFCQEALREEAFNALASAPVPPPPLRDARPQRHSGSGATVPGWKDGRWEEFPVEGSSQFLPLRPLRVINGGL